MIEYSSDIYVKLVRSMASDDMVIQAAQASSKGDNNPDTVPERLINALLKGRHGSPFEHTAFTFFIEAPIFVFLEWQHHLIETGDAMSGRYTELKPKFYSPSVERGVINVGTKMKPVFVNHLEAAMDIQAILNHQSSTAWEHYQYMLKAGIANEVARMALPVNVYSQMYWTVNARSLMNFLSLRVESYHSTFRSYPQYEIDLAARKVERNFQEQMPLTHKAFVQNGRVAP